MTVNPLGDTPPRQHGGPNGAGAAVAHDFSVNSNACGPCPAVCQALQQADATRYPDQSYAALAESLADWHGVEPRRIVMAASASEFIMRITALAVRCGVRQVHVPPHAYGDYAHAARCWGLPVSHWRADSTPGPFAMAWLCDPGSPQGQASDSPAWLSLHGVPGNAPLTLLDCAYAPLRLQGQAVLGKPQIDQVWQLWTPNKALGLTGIRAAYAIAPLHADAQSAALQALAPSWVLGAHGVALLTAWTQPATQRWLAGSLGVLQNWKNRLQHQLAQAGWVCQPSITPFFCARPARAFPAAMQAALTHAGIRLRDCTSFGLPGWWRMAALPPASQDILLNVLHAHHAAV